MFIINININLLTIQRIISKDNYEIIKWINTILTQVQIKRLIFDCESRLNSNELHKYFINHHIQTYSSISHYTNNNRIIDRVIRTINYEFNNIKTDKNLNLNNKLLQVVYFYNHCLHKTTWLIPKETKEEYEQKFIEKMI